MDTKELGRLGENVAARYLVEQGYEIITKNYRKPWGEIDIIAKKGEAVVFVEVKANQKLNNAFNPELRVNYAKVGKIKRTAGLFMQYEVKNTEVEWQIDVIGITFDIPNKKANIKHFKNI